MTLTAFFDMGSSCFPKKGMALLGKVSVRVGTGSQVYIHSPTPSKAACASFQQHDALIWLQNLLTVDTSNQVYTHLCQLILFFSFNFQFTDYREELRIEEPKLFKQTLVVDIGLNTDLQALLTCAFRT